MKGTELKNYESPVTRRTQVMLESGICAASAQIENPGNIGITEHKVNTDFEADFTGNEWTIE